MAERTPRTRTVALANLANVVFGDKTFEDFKNTDWRRLRAVVDREADDIQGHRPTDERVRSRQDSA